MSKLTIVETGRPPEKIINDWPLYPAMFEALLAPYLPDWSYGAIALSEGEVLPDPASLDAILITGSPAGVYEDTPWMTPLMDFIRQAAKATTPQIGICFGHQAIAHALGGDVAKSDKGWGIGRHVYDISAPQAWMAMDVPETFSLGVSHQDQVLNLPPGSALIGGNAFCPFAALTYPEANAISFQGHPEYSAGFSCALYGIRKGTRLSVEMVDEAEHSLETPVDNDLVGAWIAAFLKQAAD